MKKLLVFVSILFLPVLVQAQSWQYTGAMNSVRWLSEMVVLDNQTVLIVGGYDEKGTELSSCEIYDPATASWTYTGSLNIARAFPTLVKLANGHVLTMCGGTENGTGYSTGIVEDYDPSTGKWTAVGSLLKARYCPTATLLKDGRVLLAGGNLGRGDSPTCELYNPSTKTSVMTSSMSIPRATHQTVLMNDGRVLVTGGRDGGAISDYFNECEVFDPATEAWTVTGPMNQSRTMGALNIFSDGTVLAAGGRNAPLTLANGSEIFDPSTMTWKSTSPIKEPIHWTQGMLMPSDRYMVTGGIIDAQLLDPSGSSVASTSKCEWYDRTLQSWYFAPELNLTRCRHNGAYIHQTVNSNLPSDMLIVAGGQQGNITQDSSGLHNFIEGFTNTAEILDVSQPALRTYMRMPVNSGSASVGSSNSGNKFRAFYAFDGSIKIDYTLTSDDNVKIEIMSVDGRISKRIMNHSVNSGSYEESIATNDLTAGAYFIHFSSASMDKLFKFIVTK